MTRRARPLTFFGVLGGLAVAAAGLALAGCPTTTTVLSYTPITGIVIRSSSLVAGHGCGTAPGQVYRYAAVLYYAPDAGGPIGPDGGPAAYESGVFDCFADGVFSNLSASETGSLNFTVQIYAFDQAAFPASLACPAGGSAGGDAALCPGDVTDDVNAQANAATWTTSCTATQQSGVSVLAVCGPLVAAGVGDAGPDASDAAGDAGGDAAGEGGVSEGGDDGAADAPPGDDGASDAGTADADAGAPADASAGDSAGD